MVELRDLFEDRESGACGAFAVIIMSLRPAEICHDPVAEVLGDISAESSDRLGCGAMVSSNHVAPFFRVEPRGNLSGADQVAKQYRQMPPLTTSRCCYGGGTSGSCQRGIT